VLHRRGSGSGVQTNKFVSTLVPHQHHPRIDDNVCLSFVQIDILVFSSFFRYVEISFLVCRWRSSLSMVALEARTRWGSGSIVTPRLHRWDKVDLGPRKHGDIAGRRATVTCMCLAACGGPVHQLTKPHWRWCFFGSDNGRGLASLPTCV
jgi:hypothetical protein